MPEAAGFVRSLFDALNARDEAALQALCDEGVDLILVPAEAGGRRKAYVGHDALREMLDEAAATWDELRLTPGDVQLRDDVVFVSGRVHTRSRGLGMRDLPVAWVLRIREGRLASGRVFGELDEAIAAVGGERPATGA